jgi:hypothetical protein
MTLHISGFTSDQSGRKISADVNIDAVDILKSAPFYYLPL